MTSPVQVRDRLSESLSGAYRIESELGGGGMSRVFVAEELKLGRKVVVKVLSPELAEGISTERFEREIRLAASLQHAHIVPVLASGDVDGLPWFTMPFIDGESLRARVGRGPLPLGECISVLRDVVRALVYAHERGVVHRDIKPDNVMLASGTAVVTDFGIAKALSASRGNTSATTLTQIGTSIGTPAYMAPEQAAGDPNVDSRADLYAFGCTAYELLTGQSPFAGRTAQRMLAAHLSEVPRPIGELRKDTPPELASLVMRCLAKEASARPGSAAEVLRSIESITSGSMTAAPVLRGGYRSVGRMLAWYAAAFVAVAVLARAAIVGIGLPPWVFPGAIGVMLLGLPAILFTAWVQRVNQRLAVATPTLTPGGTVVSALPEGTMATIAVKATPHISWRRTWRGGAFAVGAFALAVAAFMTMRALGIGPAASLLASGSIALQEPLLVADFRITNADSSLSGVLADGVRTTLAASDVITLPTPEAIAAALRRMERPDSADLDLPLARELALRNNIKAIVTGEVHGLGASSFLVTLKLVTTDSAKELASFRETTNDAPGLIDAVDKLSRSLRGKIGESLKSVRESTPLRDATTSSLEALRKYTEGTRLYELRRSNPTSVALLREAVAIDSTFASAWRQLGMVLVNGGGTRAAADSAFEKAYAYRNKVSRSEQDRIEAAYWQYPRRDRGRGAEAYENALRRGDSATAANNLALMLVERRENARAESLYFWRERNCPACFRPLYNNLVQPLIRQQKFAQAESVATVGLSRFPGERGLARVHVNIAYLKGDTAEHRRLLDSVAAHGLTADRTWARTQLSLRALGDGKIAEWRKVFTASRPAKPTPRQLVTYATTGEDLWVTSELEGRNAVIAPRLDSAVTALRTDSAAMANPPYFNIASVYAIGGQPEKARAWLARYDAEVRDTTRRRAEIPFRTEVVAAIAFAERKYAEAIAAYRAADRRPDGPVSACDICLPINLAITFDSAGQVDSAIANYERVITKYSYDRLSNDAAVLARFSKRLGELYDQKGDHRTAAKFYADFVNLWKNADPVLQAQVAAVRQRLSQLGDVGVTIPVPISRKPR